MPNSIVKQYREYYQMLKRLSDFQVINLKTEHQLKIGIEKSELTRRIIKGFYKRHFGGGIKHLTNKG